MVSIFRARPVSVVLSVLMISICSGCATLRHPVPKDMIADARINKMDDVRLIMGESNTKLQENLLRISNTKKGIP